MNRWLACSLVGTFAGFALVAMSAPGCGGGSVANDGGPPSEGGVEDHAAPPEDHAVGKKDAGGTKDVEFPDIGTDGEAGIPEEGGPTPPAGGNLIVNTVSAGFSGVQVIGLTDDSKNVIYYGSTSSSAGVFAVPLAGGTPSTILATGADSVAISHGTVFVWTGVTEDTTTGNDVGTLAVVWTEATSSAPFKPAVAQSTAGLAAADATNTYVAYNSSSTTGTFGSIYGALATGTGGGKLLLSNTATNATATASYFNPQLTFVNSSYLVMAHQEQADSGTTATTISSFATTDWTKTDLIVNPVQSASPLNGWYFSTSTTGGTAGDTLAVLATGGTLETIPTAGPSTAATTIDTTVTAFAMLDNGSSILYGTTAGAYNQAALPGGAITNILSTGFGGFIDGCSTATEPCSLFSESPSDNYTVFYNSTGKGTTAGEDDIFYTEDIAAQTGTGILTAPSGAVFNDAFTADSTTVLYYSNFATVGSPVFGYVGYLWAYPVDKSVTAPGVSISKNNVWESNYYGTGTKIVYSDNFLASGTTGGPNGYADIKEVDVSVLPIAPKVIMLQTDVNPDGYFNTQDRTSIVWVMSQGNVHTDGIWTYKPD
jgi:hypothetical protein